MRSTGTENRKTALPRARGAAYALLAVGALASWAPAHAAEEGLERRVVIALVDSDEGGHGEDGDPVHRMLEMPLNHLGMVVRRHDVRSGPPPAAWLGEARAVLTYFSGGGASPDWLWPWLEQRARPAGVRFLHVGSLGGLESAAEDAEAGAPRLAAWLARFGLGWDRYWATGALAVEVEYRDPALCAFEDDPRGRAVHAGPWSVAAANLPWVTTSHDEDARRRTPVVTGPWGGIALDPWFITWGRDAHDRRWHVDPFAFFRAALGLEGVPAPHPSVLNGRRMFFCQVDGDGFESLSSVRAGESCASVFAEEILEEQALPFTVSVIVAGVTDDIDVDAATERMQLASRILTLPNVEPASHGVLHPIYWNGVPASAAADAREYAYPGLRGYEFGALAEVRDSIGFINERLLPGDRPCRVMLWTGMCDPPEEAILASARLGCWNLNGGVYRWDALYDSVAYVSSWGRLVGDAVQVYAGAANENDYDGFFDSMPSAFRHVDTTIERSGTGRILKPADLYVHFYGVASPVKLRVVRRLLQRWGRDEPTAPVFASTYARAVHSALTSARVLRTADGWELRDFGDCPTARIDAETRHVDWDRSRGLIGAKRIDGALYLHLSQPDADVVLRAEPVERPHVEEANHLLGDARLLPRGLVVTSSAHCPRELVVAGLGASAEVDVLVDGESSRRSADADGRLRIVLDAPGASRVEVRLP